MVSMHIEMSSVLDKVTNPGGQIETGRWLPSRLINMETHQSESELDTIALSPQKAWYVGQGQHFLVTKY